MRTIFYQLNEFEPDFILCKLSAVKNIFLSQKKTVCNCNAIDVTAIKKPITVPDKEM